MNREMKKLAALHKCAAPGAGDIPFVLAALLAAGAFGVGGLAGVGIGKLMEPGEYDKGNLEKEYELARLHRDNQTQRILAQRQDMERNMRSAKAKSMRIG